MDSIFDITKKFRTDRELREYAAAQYKALESAAKKIEQLQTEVEHLKTLLTSTTPLIGQPAKPQPVIKIQVSAEQAICEMEIQRLQKLSFERALTFEETKKLDLIMKNLFLAKGQATSILADARALEFTDAELAQLVEQPEAE